MNNLLRALAFSLIFSAIAFAGSNKASQNYRSPDELDINDLPANITKFIPAGFAALDATTGDLNLDQFSDVILVLKTQNEEDQDSGDKMDGPKRPLLILIGEAGGGYKLAGRNDNTVFCVKCGGGMGDPFQGITIKKGYFSVDHYGGSGWRWINVVTYKYSPSQKNWFLYKLGRESFHSSEPEKVTTKIRTAKNFGKVQFAKYDIYKDQ